MPLNIFLLNAEKFLWEVTEYFMGAPRLGTEHEGLSGTKEGWLGKTTGSRAANWLNISFMKIITRDKPRVRVGEFQSQPSSRPKVGLWGLFEELSMPPHGLIHWHRTQSFLSTRARHPQPHVHLQDLHLQESTCEGWANFEILKGVHSRQGGEERPRSPLECPGKSDPVESAKPYSLWLNFCLCVTFSLGSLSVTLLQCKYGDPQMQGCKCEGKVKHSLLKSKAHLLSTCYALIIGLGWAIKDRPNTEYSNQQ